MYSRRSVDEYIAGPLKLDEARRAKADALAVYITVHDSLADARERIGRINHDICQLVLNSQAVHQERAGIPGFNRLLSRCIANQPLTWEHGL